jgi:sugar lactone lactonase YvrE
MRRSLTIAALLLALSAWDSRLARADLIYVARGDFVSQGRDAITRIDTTTLVETTFATTGLSNPTALAFDSAGNLYVANFNSNTIEKFTPGGVGSVFAGTLLNGAESLAFDSAGNLYASNTNNNTIVRFTPGGVGSVFASTGLNVPQGLSFDASGNLYAVNYGTNSIEKFTPGGVGSVFATALLSGPFQLTIDAAGNFYTSNPNNNNEIVRFIPGGIGSVFNNPGGTEARALGLAFQATPVPEPSSLTLLGLAGLSLMTITRFRRGRRSDDGARGRSTRPPRF